MDMVNFVLSVSFDTKMNVLDSAPFNLDVLGQVDILALLRGSDGEGCRTAVSMSSNYPGENRHTRSIGSKESRSSNGETHCEMVFELIIDIWANKWVGLKRMDSR